MTDLKFEYTCNLDRDEDDCSPELKIDITIPQLDFKFNFHRCFFNKPLFSQVVDIIHRLTEGDKFADKGVGFRLNEFTHEEYMAIRNNRLIMNNFSISLDIVRENLIALFDTMKKQIGNGENQEKSELVDYMNKIYDYPPESLPVIKKLDGRLMLIYNPTDQSGCFDMTSLSETNKIIDYLESCDEKILNKGVVLKDSGCRLRLWEKYIDLDYGFDSTTMCPIRTKLEKENLIKELRKCL